MSKIRCPLCNLQTEARELNEHYATKHPEYPGPRESPTVTEYGTYTKPPGSIVPIKKSDEREELFKFHQNMCLEALSLLKKKNADYTVGSPFQNLEACESFGIATAERGVLIRMFDKISRLSSVLSKEHHEVEESIEDTCTDLINYSVLLCAIYFRRSKK